MNSSAEQHLARAKEYVARGEEFYRKAAEEVLAARAEGASISDAAKALDRSDRWVVSILSWAKTPANSTQGTALPFSEPQGAVAERHAKSVLRNAGADQVEGILADLPPEAVDRVAAAAHKRQIETVRKAAAGDGDGLSAEDYEVLREQKEEIRRRSTLVMHETLTALSRLRVEGVEQQVKNASTAERRDWAERLPEDIALLQLALDLCKTVKLQAVS